MSDILEWLQDWYERHCDGEWEHQHGVTIESLDNPGWRVRIDLKDTELEGRSFPDLIRTVDDRNWIHCRVVDGVFEGAGGPERLGTILVTFREWSERVMLS